MRCSIYGQGTKIHFPRRSCDHQTRRDSYSAPGLKHCAESRSCDARTIFGYSMTSAHKEVVGIQKEGSPFQEKLNAFDFPSSS